IDPKSRTESVRSLSSVAPLPVLFPTLRRSHARPGFDKPALSSIARELSATGAGSGILQRPSALNVHARASQAGKVRSELAGKAAGAISSLPATDRPAS